jgi:glutamyl-tRNA reductase
MAAARAEMAGTHDGDAVLVSCQRLEAYGFGPCECQPHERVTGRAALERLAAIAAGLESVVLGEDQVMGQVRAAFREASAELRALSDAAIASARALRSETIFRSHAGHLLDKALRLSTITPGGRLLVLGGGAMGKLVAARGVELGFEVTLAARRRPEALTAGIAFVELGRVPGLAPFEVIAGCLGSGAGEIAPRALPTARLLVDLGTPRNFNVPSGPGVIAISDMLENESQRPHAVARRRALQERLGEILTQRISHGARTASSPVGALRQEIEAMRQAEVARALRLHPDADPELLDAITRAVLDRVFHAPTVKLRESGDEARAEELLELFRAEPAPTTR